MKKYFLIIIIIFLSIFLTHYKQTSYSQLTTIKIEKGDTLWSISSKHIPDYYNNNKIKFIKDIKKINSLNSNNIKANNYIFIPK